MKITFNLNIDLKINKIVFPDTLMKKTMLLKRFQKKLFENKLLFNKRFPRNIPAVY